MDYYYVTGWKGRTYVASNTFWFKNDVMNDNSIVFKQIWVSLL